MGFRSADRPPGTRLIGFPPDSRRIDPAVRAAAALPGLQPDYADGAGGERVRESRPRVADAERLRRDSPRLREAVHVGRLPDQDLARCLAGDGHDSLLVDLQLLVGTPG